MHEPFLLAALEQAKLGRGLCAPNPSVGAVAVHNGSIIAQAYHKGAGTLHAEPLVLEQLPPNMSGVSLYITLEPCTHWGRTPPCVDAIIAYGIAEVIFAYADPNPIVAQNNATDKLLAQGIQVTHLPLPQINEFYQSYRQWTLTGKPRVTVKIAQAFDGSIGQAGERVILSNQQCAHFTHQMRQASDVVLTTAQTIEHDNPQLNVRLEGLVQAKNVAIIDRHLRLSPEMQVFKTAKQCHIYHADTVKSLCYPNSTYYQTPTQDNGLDLSYIIHHLGRLGYHEVWVEAGSTLFNTLHAQKLVDRTYIYLIPKTLSQGISAYQGHDLFTRAHSITWQAMDDNMIACLDWLEE